MHCCYGTFIYIKLSFVLERLRVITYKLSYIVWKLVLL